MYKYYKEALGYNRLILISEVCCMYPEKKQMALTDEEKTIFDLLKKENRMSLTELKSLAAYLYRNGTNL